MRGRPRNPVHDTAPPALAALAQALRDLVPNGISVRTLAAQVGVSSSSISRFMRGQVLPDRPWAKAFTEACGGNWLDVEPLWNSAARESVQARRSPSVTEQRLAAAEAHIVELRAQLEELQARLNTLENP